MDRAAAVTRIQRILGMRSDLETEIIDALKDAQVELEQLPELPWFLITEVSSIATVSGESRVPIPADFIREVPRDEDGGLFWFDSTAAVDEQWIELEKIGLNTLRNAYQSKSGPPEAYALDALYYRIGPTPDDAYTLKQVYYAKDDVLSTNIENKWLLHAAQLMIGRAGQKVAAPVRDPAAQAEFQRLEAQGMDLLLRENVARQEEGRTRQMGGKD